MGKLAKYVGPDSDQLVVSLLDEDGAAIDPGNPTISRKSGTAIATIAVNDTVSDAVDFRAYSMCGFSLPSTFDGTELSFQVSYDGATYQALYDTAGALVTVTCAASQCADAPTQLAPWNYFKVVSTTTQTTTSTAIAVSLKG